MSRCLLHVADLPDYSPESPRQVCLGAFSMWLTSQTTAQCHPDKCVSAAFLHILVPFVFRMPVKDNPILTLTWSIVNFSLSCTIFNPSANDVILNSELTASIIAKIRHHHLPGSVLSASPCPGGLHSLYTWWPQGSC